MNNDYGLTDAEVSKNRIKYGSNDILSYKKNNLIKLIINSFGDPIIRILIIALALKTIFLFRSFDWFETIGILVAIFTATFISSLSEYGSDKAFNSLMEQSSNINTKVKRNNKKIEIPISEIVVGDIVYLESGDMIPADGILLSGNIGVDESSLNGESKITKKQKLNELFRGSVVMNGEGKMSINKVGLETFYGKMANELKEKQPLSPLKKRLISLAKFISVFGYLGACIVFVLYILLYGFSSSVIINALTLAITIIIVCVPEGLPMMLTLVLSSNMKRMLKENILVRKLMGIETSGCINILFTDKTGTLTKGKLEVTKFIDGKLNEYTYNEIIRTKMSRLVQLSCVINNSSYYDDNKIIGGNITDKAILEFVGKNDIKCYKDRVIPFDSNNKYMITVIEDNGKLNLIKGAPDILLKYTKYYYNKIGNKEIINKTKIAEYISKMSKKGIRVIMLASSENSEPTNLNNLCFIGLLLIKDEIRKNVKEGIELVKKAHINTVMLTGDNKETAYSIAKEIGIVQSDKDIVITGEELNKMSDKHLKEIIPDLKVIARMLPSDKSRLVKVCQSMNLVCGMTGDGVNDAPALKIADVGFSMGSGTEVAKEASDIVILDNNYLSIIKTILYGRTIFKSIRKFIMLQLTINLCALFLNILGPFLNIGTPVTVIQMLWINMVMDTLAGIAFAFEPPLKEYMNEKPKKTDENIINKYMISQILTMGIAGSIICLLFLKLPIFMAIFKDSNTLLTAFFSLFIFIDIFNSFNSRTNRFNILGNIFNNKIFIIVMLLVAIIQIMLIYYGGSVFRTNGLNISQLLITIIIAGLVIPIDCIRKLYLNKKNINIGV